MSLDRADHRAAPDVPDVPDVLDVLRPFRAAGVLSAGDVHTAETILRLAGERRPVEAPAVALAVALAARGPRYGHVCVDLRTVSAAVVPETGRDPLTGVAAVADLPWPDPDTWLEVVRSSPVITRAPAALAVHHDLLYVERYLRYEAVVAADLTRRAASVPRSFDRFDVDALLARLLRGDGADLQRAAVTAALARQITVLVGGPGTGKTTTVAALLAALVQSDPSLRVALAAPTGKAAARMGQAFREAARHLPAGLAEGVDHTLATVEATTIHRLLGVRFGDSTRFRHDRDHLLPYDVVIIDETSMVSLPLMAKLLDAVAPAARLVLVGDPGQLASVEAGSVLADLAGPPPGEQSTGPLFGAVRELRHSRRFPPGSAIDRLAMAIRAGDADAAVQVLGDPASSAGESATVTWWPTAADAPESARRMRELVAPATASLVRRSGDGDGLGALHKLDRLRVLCAHRQGAFGAQGWNERIEQWLRDDGFDATGWYVGRPVLVTANDPRLGLANGDLGVVVRLDGRTTVAFPGNGSVGDEGIDGIEGIESIGVRHLPPGRLESVETCHAMTIHKSQGSEFDHVVVVLPPAGSRLATRELLYTAVTRARRSVVVLGDAAAVRDAVVRRVNRATGLRQTLWP